MEDPNDRWYLERLGRENQPRKIYYLNEGETKIGRDNRLDILVPSKYSSRQHCIITMREDLIGLQDLGSFNGTFVNGQEYKGTSCELSLGDIIAIGGPLKVQDAILRQDVFIFRLRNDFKESSLDDETVDFNYGEHIEEISQEAAQFDDRASVIPDSVLGSENEEEKIDEEEEHESKYALDIFSQLNDDVLYEAQPKDEENNAHQLSEAGSVILTPEIIDLVSDSEEENEDNTNTWLQKLSQSNTKKDAPIEAPISASINDPKLNAAVAHVVLSPLKVLPSSPQISEESAEESEQSDEGEIKPRKRKCVNRLSSSELNIADDDFLDIVEQNEEFPKKSTQIMEADKGDAPIRCSTARHNDTPKRKSDQRHENSEHKSQKKKPKQSREAEDIEAGSSSKQRQDHHSTVKSCLIPLPAAVTAANLEEKRKRTAERLKSPKPKNNNLRAFCASEMGKSIKKVSLKTIQKHNARKNIPVPEIIRAKELKEIRKERLKEVTQKKASSENREPLQAPMKVKVTTENRGNFLTETLPKCKIPTRRQSLDAAREKTPARIVLRRQSVDVRDSLWWKRQQVENPVTSIIPMIEPLPLYGGTHIREKTRIAHTPKEAPRTPEVETTLSSIKVIPDRQTKITFAEPLAEIREYELTQTSSDPVRVQEFSIEQVIRQVTEWKPSWLTERGENMILQVNNQRPLMRIKKSFSDFETYAETMFPLMLLDLWALVEGEYHSSITKEDMIYGDVIGSKVAGVLEVYVDAKHLQIRSGDLVRMRRIFSLGGIDENDFFGHVTHTEFFKNISKAKVILEISPNVKLDWNAKSVAIGKVATISSSLRAFSNVMSLKDSPLCSQILDPESIDYSDIPRLSNFTYCGFDQLNSSQVKVIEEVYTQCVDPRATVSLIQGPPGTGKSLVISNLVTQLLSKSHPLYPDMKILICAQSNLVVDYMTYKLTCIRQSLSADKRKHYRIVRFGAGEKISQNVKRFSLEEFATLLKREMITKRNDPKYVKNWQEKLKSMELRLQDLTKNPFNQNRDNEVNRLKTKITELHKYFNGQDFTEFFLYERFLENANIICTTLSSCCNLKKYGIDQFNICIVDEAAQSKEPWTLAPLQFGISSLVLVGDPLQLPATVLSMDAKKHGLSQSLFERLSMSPNIPVQFLDVQYRMHPEICRFPNENFYQNRMVSHESTSKDNFPWIPYSVFSLQYTQQDPSKPHSISNTVEVDFVTTLVKVLSKQTDPSQFTYGIITSHTQQKNDLIRRIGAISSDIMINTVAGYQGQERDIIIISVAQTDGIGFLANSQGLNVALTRAKKCLYICGNFISQQKELWNNFIQDAKKRRVFQTVNTINESVLLSFIKK